MQQTEEDRVRDWDSLIFGRYNQQHVTLAVQNDGWQMFREGLRGTSLNYRFDLLKDYVIMGGSMHSRNVREIRVTNYVYALKRGGMIKTQKTADVK